jgi:hypothetical protein
MNDWLPMKEQYCAQRVVGDWFKVPEGVIRTKTNPMGEQMPARDKGASL